MGPERVRCLERIGAMASRRKRESSPFSLDLVPAAAACVSDQFGDWHRDPWGWPEFAPEVAKLLTPETVGLHQIDGRVTYAGAPRFHAFGRPKSFLGIRPAVVQDPTSRIAYAAAALQVARKLEASIPDWVNGYRIRDGVLADSKAEWDLYRASHEGMSDEPHAAQTDITSHFATIDTNLLLEQLIASGHQQWAVETISAVLKEHASIPDRRGLPQRNIASALLANVTMTKVDDVLNAALDTGKVSRARRWVDDISFEGAEPALYGVIVELQERLRDVHLEMNLAKTSISPGAERGQELDDEWSQLVERDVVSEGTDLYGGTYTIYDESAIENAEARILSDPRLASERDAKRVLKSLRVYKKFDRAREWLSAADYLPHVADALSRYLRDWCAWVPSRLRQVEKLVLEAHERWPHVPSVSAHHVLAIPSPRMSADVVDLLRGWASSDSNLQRISVAVQRLAEVDKAFARDAILRRLANPPDVLATRTLALGLVYAGGDPRDAERALRGVAAHATTLKAMELRGWKLPRPAPDFDPEF